MAISNFISTVWSETLIKQLDQEYIGVKNCNRDFEGEIRGKGSTVKICSVGDITISDYTKNTDLSDPQTLSDSATNLVIDQAKSFNFQIDDVDRRVVNGGGLVVDESGVIFGDEHIAWTRVCLGDDLGSFGSS